MIEQVILTRGEYLDLKSKADRGELSDERAVQESAKRILDAMGDAAPDAPIFRCIEFLQRRVESGTLHSFTSSTK